MERTITVVLPVDDDERRGRALAPGMVATGRIGAVDNGLWRSMSRLLAALERTTGAPLIARLPFDHLSSRFDEQQRALVPFAAGVAGVVTGLGN